MPSTHPGTDMREGVLDTLTLFLLFNGLGLLCLSHFLGFRFHFNDLLNWEKSSFYQAIPWLRATQTAWLEGHFPLWNPYQGLGMPLLGHFPTESLIPTPVRLANLEQVEWAHHGWAWLRINIYAQLAYRLARQVGFQRWPSLTGTAMSALSPNLLLYNTIGSFDILLPLPLFWILIERWHRKPSLLIWVGMAACETWMLLGGKPGLQFHFMMASLAYAVWRAAIQREARLIHALPVALSWCTAALFAQPALLAFFEALSNSIHFHNPGISLSHVHVGTMITQPGAMLSSGVLHGSFDASRTFLENRFGSVWEALAAPYGSNLTNYSLLPPYGGMIALGAIAGAARHAGRPALLTFGAGYCVVSLGVIFGIAPFLWLQALPGFSLTSGYDYLPVTFIFLTLLLIHFLQGLWQGKDMRLPWRAGVAYLALVTLAALYCFWPVKQPVRAFMALALVFGACAAVAGIIYFSRQGRVGTRQAMVMVSVLLALSLWGDWRVWPPSNLAELSEAERIIGALPKSPAPSSRMAVLEPIVLPNLLTLDAYADLRVSDVMLPARYFEWSVVSSGTPAKTLEKSLRRTYYLDPVAASGRISDEIGGVPVQGVLSNKPVRMGEMLPQLSSALESDAPELKRTAPDWRYIDSFTVAVDEQIQQALLVHAPSSLLWTLENPQGGHLILEWLPNPAIWDDAAGDGFWMEASVSDASGQTVRSSLYIQPRRHAADQWKHAMMLDLSGLDPGTLTLTLQTQPGPDNDRTRDYPLLTSIRPWPDRPLEGFIEKKLGDGMYLYERDPPPPLGGRFRWSDGGADGLRFEHVATDGYLLAVDPPGGGTLINADQYYPGWRAWADGKEIRIEPHRIALREMDIPAGTKSLRVAYQPWAFRLGLWVSLASLLVGAALSMMALRQRGRYAAGPTS